MKIEGSRIQGLTVLKDVRVVEGQMEEAVAPTL